MPLTTTIIFLGIHWLSTFIATTYWKNICFPLTSLNIWRTQLLATTDTHSCTYTKQRFTQSLTMTHLSIYLLSSPMSNFLYYINKLHLDSYRRISYQPFAYVLKLSPSFSLPPTTFISSELISTYLTTDPSRLMKPIFSITIQDVLILKSLPISIAIWKLNYYTSLLTIYNNTLL